MQNVEYKITGNKLQITVDLSEKTLAEAPPSKTGKTCLVSSTSGFTKIGELHGRQLSLSLLVASK